MMPAPLDDLLRRLAGRTIHGPHHPEVRLAVRLRARNACEYCLLPTIGRFEVDHIIPAKSWADYAAGRLHGVRPSVERIALNHVVNFAWACPFCNLSKGQELQRRIGRRLYRLFDPRVDRWSDHFRFVHGYLFIVGITSIGMATELALGFNRGGIEGPLGTRHDLILAGQYPPPWARGWADRIEQP